MKIIGTTLNAKYIHTNLALRYLKTYAAPEFHIEIIEFTIKDPILQIVSDLMVKKPEVIGFSCYIWNIEETLKIIKLIKKINPKCQIILGGPEVSYNTVQLLNKNKSIDIIVIGEGEVAFKSVLSKIKQNEAVHDIPGIAYNDNGKVKINPSHDSLDMIKMPLPYRIPEDIRSLSSRIAYVETSRGCPFNCSYCLSSLDDGVRFFDLESIKDNLLYMIKNGVTTIKFLDRTLNTNTKYALDIFDFLIKNHSKGMSIQFEITADILRPEIVTYLNENAPKGLFRFEIGIQSTNEKTNVLVNRRQDFEKLKSIVMLIKSGQKIDLHLDLIAGLPLENYSSFRKTFNDVFEMRPEELQLGFLKMLHGTGIRQEADKYGYKYMDDAPYEILCNDVLPFSDVIKIKQVEDILEKYWNSHRMDLTIEYLVTIVFETPWEFFQAFGKYWHEMGWAKIGHQLEDLFLKILDFIKYNNPENFQVTYDLAKYDYLERLTHKPRSFWWEDTFSTDEKKAYFEKLIEEGKTDLPLKTLVKHFEIINQEINVNNFIELGEINIEKTTLLVQFNYLKKKTTFQIID